MARKLFQPGEKWTGNRNGRPKGAISPLTVAKNIILDVFEKDKKSFEKAMTNAMKKNPIMYYMKFVQPFMPKHLEIDVEPQSIPTWMIDLIPQPIDSPNGSPSSDL